MIPTRFNYGESELWSALPFSFLIHVEQQDSSIMLQRHNNFWLFLGCLHCIHAGHFKPLHDSRVCMRKCMQLKPSHHPHAIHYLFIKMQAVA